MRKLLTILGSLTLIGTTTSLAVSCTTNPDSTKNIIWDITTQDLINWIANHSKIRVLDTTIKFKAIEILSNLADGTYSPDTTKSQYYANNYKERFEKILEDIKSKALDSLKELEKNKKDSEIITALQEKIGVSSTSNINTVSELEKYYKLNFVMNDDTDSALVRLKAELMTENYHDETTDTIYSGILSNSQNWFMDKYFNDEKPVIVSDIVIPTGVTSISTIDLSNLVLPTTSSSTSSVQGQRLTTSTSSTGLSYLNYIVGLDKLISNIKGGYLNSQETSSTLSSNNIKSNATTNTLDDDWTKLFKTTSSGSDNGYVEKQNIKLWTDDTNEYGQYWGVVDNNDLSSTPTLYSKKTKLVTLNADSSSVSNVQKMAIYDFLANNNVSDTSDTSDNGDDSSLTTLQTIKDEPTQHGMDDIKKLLLNNGVSESNVSTITDDLTTLDSDQLNTYYTSLNNLVTFFPSVSQHSSDSSAISEDATTSSASDNNFYKVLNAEAGIISYIDADGIHISKIDGKDLFTENTIDSEIGTNSSLNNYNLLETWVEKNGGNTGKYASDKINLKYDFDMSLDSNNIGQDNDKGLDLEYGVEKAKNLSSDGTIISEGGITPSDEIQNLNNGVANKYEQFLLNLSLYNSFYENNTVDSTNTIKKSIYSDINITDDLSTYLTGSSSSDSSSTTTDNSNLLLLEYLDDIYGNNENKIINSITSDSKIRSGINSQINLLDSASNANFISEQGTWASGITKNYEEEKSSTTKKYTPNITLWDDQNIDAITNSSLWKTSKNNDLEEKTVFLYNISITNFELNSKVKRGIK